MSPYSSTEASNVVPLLNGHPVFDELNSRETDFIFFAFFNVGCGQEFFCYQFSIQVQLLSKYRLLIKYTISESCNPYNQEKLRLQKPWIRGKIAFWVWLTFRSFLTSIFLRPICRIAFGHKIDKWTFLALFEKIKGYLHIYPLNKP